MFPTYDQQYPIGYPYGIQQPQKHGYGFQSSVFGPNNIPMNWSGGMVNGQQMPFPLAPPPFFYPFDGSSSWNKDQSKYSRKDGKPSYDNRKRSVTPRRGNFKNNRQRNTPKQRRLVDFMPETWQNLNQIDLPDNSRQSKTMPIHQKNMNNNKNNDVQSKKKKTSDKAHLNTLRRRERRQRNRAFLPNKRNEELGRLNDNRFIILSENDDDTEADNSEAEADNNNQIRAMNKNKSPKKRKPTSNMRKDNIVVAKQTNTTNEVNTDRIRINQHKSDDLFLTVNDRDRSSDEVSSRSPTDKRKLKLYLQDYKILSYLKVKLNDRKMKDLKDSFNEIYKYAKDTLPTYDKWVYNHYEAQVWQQFYELGKNKDHWAKEIVDKTHTRDDKRNLSLCENKISHFTSACIDANDIITRTIDKFSSNQNIQAIANAPKRVHDLMLDYIKESTIGLTKMNNIRIRRASLEKDEWTALKAFENMATEQQKIYANTFCRPALKAYHKKKKNFELVAAHISNDIIPKNLPQYDFSLPMDESSLSAEEILKNKKSIEELSKDFRIKATELYLKVAKGEYDFQNERLDKLLRDFPPDTYDVPLTQIQQAAAIDKNDGDEADNNGCFTQRVRTQIDIIESKGSEMFTEYVEISYKKALLEIEREVLFLDERSVKETPFEIQEARKMNPVLRKDFTLQI
ncbi:hypothetical protein I4U23_021977 [Adineta vaga]|nr:hypothetical protein I4U23_021977 [Adineta vaga]